MKALNLSATKLCIILLLGGVFCGCCVLGAKLFLDKVIRPIQGPPYTLRIGVPPLDDQGESELQSFMLVDPGINIRRGEFIAVIDSPVYDFHARLRLDKNGLDQLLSTGWSITSNTAIGDDSEVVQKWIGREVGWDYLPVDPGDIHISNKSGTSAEYVQGIVRSTAGGYIVFVDRRLVSADHVPKDIRDSMLLGACDASFPSQEELDYRYWDGSVNKQSPRSSLSTTQATSGPKR